VAYRQWPSFDELSSSVSCFSFSSSLRHCASAVQICMEKPSGSGAFVDRMNLRGTELSRAATVVSSGLARRDAARFENRVVLVELLPTIPRPLRPTVSLRLRVPDSCCRYGAQRKCLSDFGSTSFAGAKSAEASPSCHVSLAPVRPIKPRVRFPWALEPGSSILWVGNPSWGRSRTCDTWIMSPLLYRLSYPCFSGRGQRPVMSPV